MKHLVAVSTKSTVEIGPHQGMWKTFFLAETRNHSCGFEMGKLRLPTSIQLCTTDPNGHLDMCTAMLTNALRSNIF